MLKTQQIKEEPVLCNMQSEDVLSVLTHSTSEKNAPSVHHHRLSEKRKICLDLHIRSHAVSLGLSQETQHRKSYVCYTF